MKQMMAYKQMHSFLSEVWKLYARYAEKDLDDNDLECFREDVQTVSKKYQDCAFAIPVLIELVNEVERIAAGNAAGRKMRYRDWSRL